MAFVEAKTDRLQEKIDRLNRTKIKFSAFNVG